MLFLITWNILYHFGNRICPQCNGHSHHVRVECACQIYFCLCVTFDRKIMYMKLYYLDNTIGPYTYLVYRHVLIWTKSSSYKYWLLKETCYQFGERTSLKIIVKDSKRMFASFLKKRNNTLGKILKVVNDFL